MSLINSNRIFSSAFRDMHRTMAALDPLFRNSPQFGLTPTSFEDGSFWSTTNSYHPVSDIIDAKDHYEIQAEIPGYDKKDINIELPDDHTLILSGSSKKEYVEDQQQPEQSSEADDSTTTDTQNAVIQKKEDDQKVSKYKPMKLFISERSYGSFSRTFVFPSSIDSGKVTATYTDGILKVLAPKNIKSEPKVIKVD